MISFAGVHFEKDILLTWVRWYVAYPLSHRQMEEMMQERGVLVDYSTIQQQDRDATLRFLTKAIRRHGVPATITIDGSEGNTSAIRGYNEAHRPTMAIRQVRYLNNLVEQGHHGVKWIIRPVLGLKAFGAAQQNLVRVELMCMLLRSNGRRRRTGPHRG